MNEGVLRDFLLDSGLVSRSQLEEVLGMTDGRPLPETLVERGILSDDEMRRALAGAYGMPFVTLSPQEIDPETLALIPEPLSRNRQMVAYRASAHEVEVALLDLNDLGALEFFKPTRKVLPRLTSRESLKHALLHYQKVLKQKFGESISRDMQAIVEPAPGASEELLRYSAERLPVVYVADALMRHAISQKAGHIHLEQSEGNLRVRYRIMGIMYDAMILPRHAAHALILRFKLLAGLTLKSVGPQEGRFKVTIDDEAYSVRVSAMQIVGGEKVVLRITPEASSYRGFTLESLGFHGDALERVHSALLKRKGLVLVYGPSGSGKTTTLYTLLDLLHGPHVSLVTVEERVETRLPYATQTTIDRESGLTPALALRSAFKLDPDVLLMGDIEDSESVHMLSSAAARGMLVLAGTQDENVFTEGVEMLILVRRARRLCTKHKNDTHKLSRSELTLLESAGADFTKVLAALKEEGILDKEAKWRDLHFARAEAGCADCEQGYSGSIGFQEVITQGESGLNLLEDALFKAAAHQTTIEEIMRLLEVSE